MESINPGHDLTRELTRMHRKGVRLWTERGQLRYQAPKGALTAQDIDRLKEARSQLIALLGEGPDAHDILRPPPTSAPLAFSQLMYWNMFQLGERGGHRQVTSATRLLGPLDIGILKRSIAEVIRRHDALRTHIVIVDGTPTQEVATSLEWDLRTDNLTSVPQDRQASEIQQLIDTDILEPVDLETDPLFGFRLIELQADEHALIIVLEHIISDAVSIRLLLAEILQAYAQIIRGQPAALPQIAVQFPNFAARLRDQHPAWLDRHESYWTRRLQQGQRLAFPEPTVPAPPTQCGWGAVPIHIDASLKRELQSWCRARRTTLVLGILTTYIALVLRWCSARELLFQYEFDGRVTPEVANTIGYFASALYLHVELFKQDTFTDLARRVTAEYCNAYEHADHSWMAAQLPRPQFARNTVFNWVPQSSQDTLTALAPKHPLRWEPITFEHPVARTLQVDGEPSILLFDTDEGITGGMYYPRNRLTQQTMEGFTSAFFVFLKALCADAGTRISDLPLSWPAAPGL
jgi:hypothetical protein